MLEGHRAGELLDFRKHFHEHDLRQVFFTRAPRQMRPNQFDDQRIKLLEEHSRCLFVPSPHARQALGHIESGLWSRIGSGHPLIQRR